MITSKNRLWANAIGLSVTLFACSALGDEPTKTRADLHEPVFRVTKQERSITTKTTSAAIVSATSRTPLSSSPGGVSDPLTDVLNSGSTGGTQVATPPVAEKVAPAVQEHPLQGPLRIAEKALAKSASQINDYTAVLVKRERVGGTLNDPQYMFIKVRNEKKADNGTVTVPFSFYIKFLKPSGVKGREVIFVRGENNNKLIAHEGGFKGRFTPCLYLDPNGAIAMMGQRYPATDLGIEKLCRKLIARGTRDMKNGGECTVEQKPANINQRAATRVEVTHKEKLPHLDFHKARIFIDNEYGFPVRYEAYDWPRVKGGAVSEDQLIEEYTYVRLKFNVGLTDQDFNPANPDYKMK